MIHVPQSSTDDLSIIIVVYDFDPVTTGIALVPLKLPLLGFDDGFGGSSEDGAEEGEDGVVGGFVGDALGVDDVLEFGIGGDGVEVQMHCRLNRLWMFGRYLTGINN